MKEESPTRLNFSSQGNTACVFSVRLFPTERLEHEIISLACTCLRFESKTDKSALVDRKNPQCRVPNRVANLCVRASKSTVVAPFCTPVVHLEASATNQTAWNGRVFLSSSSTGDMRKDTQPCEAEHPPVTLPTAGTVSDGRDRATRPQTSMTMDSS